MPRTALYHNVGGRFVDVSAQRRRRPPRPRRRLRRSRLQHGRSHRPLRDQRRVQRRDGRLGRAPLERRRRDLHRRRRPSGHRRAGLALGSRGRRRQRGRATGSLRLVLHGSELRRRSGIRLPVRPQGGSRPPVPQRGPRQKRALDASARLPEPRASRGRRSATGSARCSRTSTATDASISTSRTTPTRTSSTATCRAAGALGFRFEDVGKRLGVDDPNAGMGIAAADYSGDGRVDLFVTNSRHQLHAAYRSPRSNRVLRTSTFAPTIAAVIGTDSTAWGASWADLDLDGDLDLVLANGAIPVVNLAKDARRVQILENVACNGKRASLRARESSRSRPDACGERTRSRDGRLRQRRRPRRGGQLDRRKAASFSGTTLRTRHWLEVRLAARSAPGAVVTATLPSGRRLVREVQAGSSYLSSEDPRVHFGLGTVRRVRTLEVDCPTGASSGARTSRPDRVVDRTADYRPERCWSRVATVSSVTARSRMIPVTT